MGAEATSSIGGVWARLEGQVVDDQFPLRRFLGSSEHSGVFLTDAPANQVPSEVALKLVSVASSARAESQLARWYAVAAGVSHPHLVEMFDVGRCNVAGLGNLYAVMEYADQDLAQLLQRRALTEEETREMLVPVLSALAFLHERKLVMGRMKPSNVLVVGEQLKLASDAIRAVGEVDDVRTLSAYDPPEARDGSCSPAGDVWALGVTICEALTRRQPLGLMSSAGMVVLPPDLPPAFREIVGWCLRRQPQDRPEIAEIDAWLSGQPVQVATEDSSAPFADETTANELLEGEVSAGARAVSAPTSATSAPSTPAAGGSQAAGVEGAYGAHERASGAAVMSSATMPSTPMSSAVAPSAVAPGAPGASPSSASVTPVDVELAAGLESPPAKPASIEPAVVVAPKSAPATPPPAASAATASAPATRSPAASANIASAVVSGGAAAASTAAPAAARRSQESAAPMSAPAPSNTTAAPNTAKATPARAPEVPPAANGALPAATLPMSRAPAAATPAPTRAAPAAETSAPNRAPASAASAPNRPASAAETTAPNRLSAPATSVPSRAAPTAETPTPSRAPAAAGPAPRRVVSAAEPPAPSRVPTPVASAPSRPASAAVASAPGRATPAIAPSAPQRPPAAVTPIPTRAPSPARPAAAPPKPAETVSKWTPVESPTPRERRRADADAEATAPPPRRSLILLALGVVVIIGVVWAGIRMFGTKPPSQAATDTVSVSRPDISDAEQAAVPPEPTESAPGVQGSPGGSSSAGISGRPNASVPTRGKSAANTRAAARAVTAAPGAPSVAIQEVLPDVPPRSRRTIRGHVRVSVRLIVEQDGTVFAALAEQRGPSRYFERLAIDAAKKWTFTPSDSEAQRLMLVKFDFTRDGATADAVPLN